MEFKHIKAEQGYSIIPDRYLDESPQPPKDLIQLIDDYIVHHMFVAYPFKATPEQKEEIELNTSYCRHLEQRIQEYLYAGIFALSRHGYIAVVDIDFGRESKYEHIIIKWIRSF